jgi:hypothetical protein
VADAAGEEGGGGGWVEAHGRCHGH